MDPRDKPWDDKRNSGALRSTPRIALHAMRLTTQWHFGLRRAAHLTQDGNRTTVVHEPPSHEIHP